MSKTPTQKKLLTGAVFAAIIIALFGLAITYFYKDSSAMSEKTVEIQPKKMMLYPDGTLPEKEGNFIPYLNIYTIDSDKALGCVLVLPGGGYTHRARHEADIVAQKFNSLGFHAAVLEYRVYPELFPAPQQDAMRAIRLLRHHSRELGISADHIAILGFSAGGHLAASAGVLDPDLIPTLVNDQIDALDPRPNASILCYPVISLVKFGHVGSGKHLLGEDSSDAEREKLSLQNLVTEKTPPAFLWHTATDQAVPCENSIVFAKELWKRNIPAELHIFPEGKHGKGLATEIPDAGVWPDLAAEFIKNIAKFPAK